MGVRDIQHAENLKNFEFAVQFQIKLKKWQLLQPNSYLIKMITNILRLNESARDAWLQMMKLIRLTEYKQADFHEQKHRVRELVADYARAKQELYEVYGDCHIDGKTCGSLLKGVFKRGLLDKINKRLPHCRVISRCSITND